MDAGAATIAFITVALQSTKAVYEVISTVRNGPREINQLATAAQSLQQVLIQLSECRVVQDAGPDADLSIISGQLRRCYEDLSHYANELQKVMVYPAQNKVERAWKHMKRYMKEEELQRMSSTVHNHVAVLSFHLNILQSDTNIYCREELSRLSHDMGNSRREHTVLLQQQNTCLSAINASIHGFKERSAVVNGGLFEDFSSLHQKVDQIPEMSARQSSQICESLGALQDQISKLVDQNRLQPANSPPAEKILKNERNGLEQDDMEISGSIARLCELARHKESMKHSEEAEDIIDDLDRLLEFVSNEMSHRDGGYRGSRKGNTDETNRGERANIREFKRVRGLLTASESIAVNKQAMPWSLIRRGKTFQLLRKEIQTSQGEVIITTKRRKEASRQPSSEEDCEPSEVPIEVITSIKSHLNRNQSVVSASFFKRNMPDGFITLSPIISVGMTLPDDAEIFRCLKEGNINRVRHLFREGMASVRDCNSHGTPLLFYAMSQPEICKFLIEHGADVDEIARDPFVHRYKTPLGVGFDFLEEPGKLASKRLLLDAGADPTLEASGYGQDSYGNAFWDSICYVTEASLKLYLDHWGKFINLNDELSSGSMPLLHLAEYMSPGYDPQRFDLLLRRGADIHATNEIGETCLHICVRTANLSMKTNPKESLVFLIKKGADVRARDNFGRSVSEVAYMDYNSCAKTLAGYRGDLWDAVLSECGFDLSEFRRGFPRRPGYTTTETSVDQMGGPVLVAQYPGYTREDFERLWRGREDQCPYYDDPPMWDAEKGAIFDDNEDHSRSGNDAHQEEEDSVESSSSSPGGRIGPASVSQPAPLLFPSTTAATTETDIADIINPSSYRQDRNVSSETIPIVAVEEGTSASLPSTSWSSSNPLWPPSTAAPAAGVPRW